MEYGYGYDQGPDVIGLLSSGVWWFFSLAIVFLMIIASLMVIIAWWKIFTKAGHPGWFSLIPILNLYTMLQIVQRPAWWLFLYLIPVVNVVVSIIVTVDSARVFGKGLGFALGLVFFPFIFYLILGFGDARYQPSGSSAFIPPAPPAG